MNGARRSAVASRFTLTALSLARLSAMGGVPPEKLPAFAYKE